MDEAPSLIQIKGLRDGLLITLGDAPWPELEAAFITHIDDQPSFFQGARVTLDVGAQVLRVAELSKLRDLLSERGISLWAVLSESAITETTAQNLGLATRLGKPRPSEVHTSSEEIPENAALWVQQTLRSGQRVEYEGHVQTARRGSGGVRRRRASRSLRIGDVAHAAAHCRRDCRLAQEG